jgi:hypothetical protein
MHRANRIGNPCLVLEDRASDKNHDPQPDSEYMNELRDLFKDKINIESVKTKGEASTAFCRFYNNHLKEIKGGNK